MVRAESLTPALDMISRNEDGGEGAEYLTRPVQHCRLFHHVE